VGDENVKAFIFDYGGVLMRTVTWAPRHELDQRLGLEPGRIEKIVFESSKWDGVQSGQISYEAFWEDIAKKVGMETDSYEVLADTFWAGDRLDENLVNFIRHLRREGYGTALLSNAPRRLRGWLEELDIVDAFDTILISGEEGMAKPDPAIYELILGRLGVAPEEAVFVDDMRENVSAARQVGLKAVRFQGPAPLRKRLRSWNLPVLDPTLEPLQNVRAVIFDWGGVMEAQPDDDLYQTWERRLSLEPGSLEWLLWGETWRQLSSGQITEQEYAARIADNLGMPDAEAVQRFMAEFMAEDRFYPEMAETVRALRERYQVALLSNAGPDQVEWARERYGFDIDAEFDVYINSAHEGMRKPNEDIFHLALERLSVEPRHAVFLDDMVYNVDAAREIGIHTVQFVDPEMSLPELETLLGHAIEHG
jgi:epoxide hydrolase-like predicted phosphatase